jgi:Flp pilus assembly protein TadG
MSLQFALVSTLRNFLKQSRGSAALLFGLSILPIAGAIGASVDYSRASNARANMSDALDSALLALAKNPNILWKDADEYVTLFIDTNFNDDDHINWSLTSLTNNGQEINASVEMDVSTLTLNVIGQKTISVKIASTVRKELSNLELVMVLDNTGSMNSGGKIGALRDAARNLVDILDATAPADTSLKVGLVPFVTAVNVKATEGDSFNLDWIDTEGESSLDFVHFDESTWGKSNGPKSNYELFNRMKNASWKGCVLARAEPYDLLDTPPNQDDPETLFVPYLWPDEPDTDNDYNNDYMDDKKSGNYDTRQRHLKKYRVATPSIDESPSHTSGPNKSCADPILPLTDNLTKVRQRIADMRAWNNGGTIASEGIAWGWRVISPTEPFTQGVEYNDEETRKVMVVLTDGENQIWGGWDTHNDSDYTSYGYLADNRLGTDNKNVAKGVINQKVSTLCSRIKEHNVEVYTVTFQVNSGTIRTLFTQCATRPDMAFHSDSNGALIAAFNSIANDMSLLRLTK